MVGNAVQGPGPHFHSDAWIVLSRRYCQVEANSPVLETKSSNSGTMNQQLRRWCRRSRPRRMAQVDNTKPAYPTDSWPLPFSTAADSSRSSPSPTTPELRGPRVRPHANSGVRGHFVSRKNEPSSRQRRPPRWCRRYVDCCRIADPGTIDKHGCPNGID